MKEKLETIRQQALEEITQAGESGALEQTRVKYLGRKGELTQILRGLSQVAPEERKAMGQAANEIKEAIANALDKRKKNLEAKELEEQASRNKADLTLPGRRPRIGHKHLISQVIEEIVDIFSGMGFQTATGPDIETEYYNFESMNTPEDHPARDLHDTFFVKDGVVLRTHTSPVQMRVMESTNPPVAVVVPGRTFRVDNDASHSPMFFQIEGLLVDKGVNFAELKGALMHFVHSFFGKDIAVRFRPHYFPFTEPSAEMDISCTVCGGQGCRLCKHQGWLEILGCGMVHPQVFRYAGYDVEEVTGFAFGMGVDRIALLKHSVDSIHHLYENDLRFLEQF